MIWNEKLKFWQFWFVFLFILMGALRRSVFRLVHCSSSWISTLVPISNAPKCQNKSKSYSSYYMARIHIYSGKPTSPYNNSIEHKLWIKWYTRPVIDPPPSVFYSRNIHRLTWADQDLDRPRLRQARNSEIRPLSKKIFFYFCKMNSIFYTLTINLLMDFRRN